ncbi:hypothetical protein [Hufsiella ginkgonis]|uniref:Uncharacterized protein n=1 Tax=Hufsiella ginkgonis TaxID=2695274 RepID=A0A7K1Y0R0_9SPHI|nr:hypothetical protein [Hufsiella ginkgonis]MXV16825.1 hypothetical protein [Hufsiella ginkgonis]
MAINIKPGPNLLIAKATAELAEVFDDDNLAFIYRLEGSYDSWKPGRPNNAIEELEIDVSYLVIATAEMDLSALFY